MEQSPHSITTTLLFHHLHHLAAGVAINHTKQVYSIGEMPHVQFRKTVINGGLHDQLAIDIEDL